MCTLDKLQFAFANKTWKSCNSLYANVQICWSVCKLRQCQCDTRWCWWRCQGQLSHSGHGSWQFCSAAARVSVKWKLLPMLTSCCVSCVCVSAAQWCAVNSVMFVLVNNVLQQLDLYFTTGYFNLTTFGTGRPSWNRSAPDPIPKRAWMLKGWESEFFEFH